MSVSPDDFRAAALAFLEAHATRRQMVSAVWGEGSDRAAIFEEASPEQERVSVAAVKAWRAAIFDAGFGWITGPPEFGGRGLPRAYERIWLECEAEYVTPSKIPLSVSLGMVAPTLLACGSDVVKKSYLLRLYRAEMIACQLFSEPGAGSDLASVATRAERDGDKWVLNGQKVWTSCAHYSDIGEILCRTNPAKPKHKGLTMFVIDMRAPGVEVRPLRQMTGGASFNEVFLTDVRVPDDHRLGSVDEGWSVALTTLMNERSSIGDDRGGVQVDVERLRQLLCHSVSPDPNLRLRFADIFINDVVSRCLQRSLLARTPAGQVPGPEMSLTKMALVAQLQRVSDFVTDALGPALAADTGEWGTYAWTEFVLGVPGMRVGGGTDEVLRNIVGERVLGLPKEHFRAERRHQ